jgi:phosphatidylinositol alpha-1,6-mannosyltransferase
MTAHPSSKILIITRNLPPLVGGMERLNWHMADELSKYAEVKVIGPQGAAARKPERISLTEAPLKPLPLFLLISFFKALWLALRWRPDVILAGSGLTAPIAWLASKLCGARSAVYLHGLDITVKNKLYQRFWAPTFSKMDHIIVNSTPTKGLAFAAGVPERKMTIVHPGVTLPEAPQPAVDIQSFKEQHGLIGRKILLSVGRLTTRKGLREFVELSLPSIVEAEPNAMLVVIGEAPKNSLGAGIQTVESIQEQAKLSGVIEHVLFLGRVSERDLSLAYESADVHVFPIRDLPGDPEGFGMVAIEAAAHGLPTVAFATGGVVDAVREEISGHLIKPDNYQALSAQVVKNLLNPTKNMQIYTFSREFSWKGFGKAVSLTTNYE